MMSFTPYRPTCSRWSIRVGLLAVVLGLFAPFANRPGAAQKPPAEPGSDYTTKVRPLVAKYCFDCHSTQKMKSGLDLERFATIAVVRADVKAWEGVIEQLEADEMPPKDKPQPTAAERKQLISWVRTFLDDEARTRAGDPGHVPLRRLSNAEYDATIRDLTGVNLQPAREFPVDGAAGEGFTNAAESLSDISPALFTKYLNAAKNLADHAVLLPDGFRFSSSKTRRDWTVESTTKLRQYYKKYDQQGRFPAISPYLTATIRHRDALLAGQTTTADVAAKEKLHPKYLAALWQALNDKTPSEPFDTIRAKWKTATENDLPALVAEIEGWRTALWRSPVGFGNYTHAIGAVHVESLSRNMPNDPPALESVPIRVAVKPVAGQPDLVLNLESRDLSPGPSTGLIWHRPRFEAAGKPPLLLKDYSNYGPAFEFDYQTAFASTAVYLLAAVEASRDPKASLTGLAKQHRLDPAFLERWVAVLALAPGGEAESSPAIPLTLLDLDHPRNDKSPAVTGWMKKGGHPALLSNPTDKVELVPGRIPPHSIVVHPSPKEFAAVTWKSPVAGTIQVAVRVTHAHPGCGNGVGWWLEKRTGIKATTLAKGVLDLGKEAKPDPKAIKVETGDVLVLGVDSRDGNHACDLTELGLTITEDEKLKRVWDLAADVADTVKAGNPHADKHGNADTWSFASGVTKVMGAVNPHVPAGSLLAHWSTAVVDPQRQPESEKLSVKVQELLSGSRPTGDKDPNRVLYDKLVGYDSPLFQGVDLAKLAKQQPNEGKYGLAKNRFGMRPDGQPVDAASIPAASGATIGLRLPAALFVGREFVVDVQSDGPLGNRGVAARAVVMPAPTGTNWNGPVLATPDGAAHKHFVAGREAFRQIFPLYYCYPPVVPNDAGGVTLKLFHREDEPLVRLFLDDKEAAELDKLWAEHRFVSRQAVLENEALPQFIGFVTQDQPKAMLAFFESQRPAFKKRADDLVKDEAAAVPKQLEAIQSFAARAYRRPLSEKEKSDLLAIYHAIRDKGASHEEAFRGVLTRVFVSPAFLFRIEQAPKGKEPAEVSDWELATRLSYFLWSSMPDDELRTLAASGQLRDPKVLAAQTDRMLKDDRTRSLAIEFGTQWVHVRGFDELKEKNEKLFPTFDATLRKAIYEESILFFQDLFRSDRAVTQVIDADYTFLNDALSRHYGIPGVVGPQWRKVDGVKKYGRGGVLGLASIQAKESGASRTSPILRGNWVSETLLGEKLPLPPQPIPRLPEEEGGADGLTTRQRVEAHTKVKSCAACHVRIDPLGFALEKYDPIGRLREKDLGGLPVDVKAKLRDGTEFEGIDGLRTYLMTTKKDVIVRLFCRRLLGYALGRAVTLSDTSLLDEMVAELNKNEGRVTAAVQAIVRSPQFRKVRGSDFAD